MIYKILFVAFCCGVLLLCCCGGVLLLWGVGIMLLACGVWCKGLWDKWRHKKQVEWYADRFENIYECSLWEHDKDVVKRAKEHRKMLAVAENRAGVMVHELIFQDLRPSESWVEFEQRRDAFILEDRTARMEWLSKTNRPKYVELGLKQRA